MSLSEIRHQLEMLINATPSGQCRNILCDANILLMQAQVAQQIAQEPL